MTAVVPCNPGEAVMNLERTAANLSPEHQGGWGRDVPVNRATSSDDIDGV